MKQRMMISALAVAAGLFASQAVFAADGNLDRGDRKFLQRAAQAGKLEIDASRLAVERATTPQVREYAEKMIADHTAVDQELKALAQQKGVELPADLRWKQSRVLKSLQGEDDVDDFEEEYVEKVAVDAHEDAVELFKDAADDADDAAVKAFAVKHLPALEQHLAEGQRLKDLLDDRDGRRQRPGWSKDDKRPAPAGSSNAPSGLNDAAPGAASTGGGTGATTQGGAAIGNAPASQAQPGAQPGTSPSTGEAPAMTPPAGSTR